ncbi:MAG: LPS export ABC transporter permease LptG [Steroidobacteraceae bacterium]
MSILARYVIRDVLLYTLLVVLVLTILSGLYLFITQQDDIGTGNYTLGSAFLWVGLNLPQYVFQLLPIAALIGTLLGLGNLARAGELTVMRAAGVSVLRLAGWVASAGLILMMLASLLGEFVAPRMEQYARQLKTFQKYRDVSLTGDRNAWAKDGDTILSLQQQSSATQYGGVLVIRLTPLKRLDTVGRASTATLEPDGRLLLRNYVSSQIVEDEVRAHREGTAQLSTRLSREFLGLAVVEPDAVPLTGLRTYIAHLQANGLEATRYEIAFWARIARTCAIVVVVMLAIPFSFGPMRSTGTGARMVVGILIGTAFFLVARMLESGGAVFDLQPFLIGWLPVWMLAAVTIVALLRVR